MPSKQGGYKLPPYNMIRCPLAKQQQTDSLSHLLLVGSVEYVVQIPENDFLFWLLSLFSQAVNHSSYIKESGKNVPRR